MSQPSKPSQEMIVQPKRRIRTRQKKTKKSRSRTREKPFTATLKQKRKRKAKTRNIKKKRDSSGDTIDLNPGSGDQKRPDSASSGSTINSERNGAKGHVLEKTNISIKKGQMKSKRRKIFTSNTRRPYNKLQSNASNIQEKFRKRRSSPPRVLASNVD